MKECRPSRRCRWGSGEGMSAFRKLSFVGGGLVKDCLPSKDGQSSSSFSRASPCRRLAGVLLENTPSFRPEL